MNIKWTSPRPKLTCKLHPQFTHFLHQCFYSTQCIPFLGSEGGGVQPSSVPASLVPYSLSFSARVSSPRPIAKVESNCSLDPLQYLNTEQTQATVVCLRVCLCVLCSTPLKYNTFDILFIISDYLVNCRSSWLKDTSLTGMLSCWFITKMPTSPLLWWRQDRSLPSLVSGN